jgi:two-component system KDP operon response regulator KdpE
MDVSHPCIASIALVTEDAALAESVGRTLRDESTRLVTCSADALVLDDRPDLVLLDRAGERAVASRILRLRRRWPTIGIIVLNAMGDGEVMQLLDQGADDVIVRGSAQLESRLHAHARRARTINAGLRLVVGDIVFDREDHRVWVAGSEVRMTPREFALLDCMFRNAPRAVGSATLADFVWGDADPGSRRSAVEVYIGYLRRKLARSHSVMIRTVRGVGYRFERRS